MSRISLCLIARNEAHFLDGCLESVKGLVDQIVVADTGSTDETKAIAERHGAMVVDAPWEDDFSKARNACLPHATGDWVLLLDADERLIPEALPVLRKAADVGGFDCAMLPLADALQLNTPPELLTTEPAKFKAPVFLHRFFKRDEGLKWKNRIHESVIWLEEPGRVVIRLEAPIVHYGNVEDVRKRFEKDDRNFKLIQKVCEEEPDNLIMTAIYLSDRYRRSRDQEVHKLAATTYHKLVANFEQEKPLRHPRFLNVATIQMWFQMRDHCYADARETFALAGEWGLHHPNLTWMGGTCYENLAYREKCTQQRKALLAQALELYLQLPEEHGKTFVAEVSPGLTQWLAHLSAGRVLMRLNRPEEAQSHYQLALEQLPVSDASRTVRDQRRTAILGHIESLIDQRQFRDAMRLIRQSSAISDPDLQVLRADVYERTGKFNACVDMLNQVMSATSLPPFLVTSCENRLRELLSLINLYKGSPMPGVGSIGTIAAVLAGHAPEDLKEPWPLDEERIKRVLSYLQENQPADYLDPFKEAQTQAALPNLCKALQS